MQRQRTPRRSIGIVLASLALLAASCTTDDGVTNPPSGSPPAVTFAGTSWRLVSGVVDGASLQLHAERPPTLIIDDDGGAGGTTGCNSFGGSVSVDGGALGIEVGSMTEIGCEPALMNLESVYLDALSRVEAFAWNADDLQLTSSDGSVTLDFTAIQPEADRSLGTTRWMLNGFVSGGAVSSPVAGIEAFLEFDLEAGEVGGSSGCNDFAADVILDGNTVAVSTIVSSAVGCEPPSVMRQEAQLFDILELAETWAIEGAHLTMNASDGRAVTFTALLES